MGYLRYLQDAWRGEHVQILPATVPGLQRHVVHDPKSRLWDVRKTAKTLPAPTQPVMHERHCEVWDQNNCNPEMLAHLGADPSVRAVGACTANGTLGMLVTGKLWDGKRTFTEDDCLVLYHQESIIDDHTIPGVWPTQDTGSAAVFAMRILRQRGWVRSYRNVFRFDDLWRITADRPVTIGTTWLNSMFEPDRYGTIRVDKTSDTAGGHQYLIDGNDPVRRRYRICNSWGEGWGQSGRAWVGYDDMHWLLAQRGDALTVA